MMAYHELGSTGLQVSRVSFGGWAIGGGFAFNGKGVGFGLTDDDESRMAIRAALECGVNLFDTADAYGAGHSEELIGEVLVEAGADVLVATKVGNQRRDPLPSVKNFAPDYIRQACEASLRRLRRDTIDIYQLHNPAPDVTRGDEVWEALGALRDAGKIRFIGVSVSTPAEGIELINVGRVDCLQVLYNLLWRGAEDRLFPLAQERGIGIIARVPLASGILTGKLTRKTTFDGTDHRHNWLTGDALDRAIGFVDRVRELSGDAMPMPELALRFVLSHPAVSTCIPGCKTAAQVAANTAASGGGLPDTLLEQLKTAVPGDCDLGGHG